MDIYVASRRLVVLAVAVLVAAACSGGEGDPTVPTITTVPTPTTSTTATEVTPAFVSQPGDGVPVIVDYSPTSSDVAALLFVLHAEGVRVDAITIPGTGESHCEQAVANTLSLLLLVDKEGIPVACGSQDQVAGDNQWPDAWREAADELPGLALFEGGPPSPLTGPELLAAAVTGSTEPVRLLTLGPLTNVAAALALEPTLVDNLESIHIMGGAVEAAGNVFANNFAEWNVWIDPAAAQTVLESGAPITLIPLDATNDVPVTQAWFDRLRQDRTTPAASGVFDLFSTSPGVLDGGFYFWDELAAAAMVDPSYVTLEEMSVAVVQSGSEEGWTKPDAAGTRVQVAIAADSARFQRDLISVLNGRTPVDLQPADPELVAYFEALEAIVERSDADITQFFENNQDLLSVFFEPEALPVEQARQTYGQVLTVFLGIIERELEDSSALDVPTEADALHEGYLASVEGFESSIAGLLDQIDTTSVEDLSGLFESEFDEPLDALFTACSGLQSLAFEKGVDVNLICNA